MWKSDFRQNYYRTSFSPTVPPFAARISRVVADGGTWWLKWERPKAGESNGKLPPRTCSGCSVPEPYRSHDWALVLAKPGLQGWILMNEWCGAESLYRIWSLILPWRNSSSQARTMLLQLVSLETPHILWSRVSLPCSQDPDTCSYPETDKLFTHLRPISLQCKMEL